MAQVERPSGYADPEVYDPKAEVEGTEENREDAHSRAVATCADWLERDRSAKDAIEDEWDEIDKLLKGTHWDLLGPDGNPLRTESQQAVRPNSVENVTFALVDGQVAEFAQEMELIDFPTEQGDEETANLMTDLKKAIAYKNRLDLERLHWNRYFFGYGTGIWEHVYDPLWKGGRGPNRWRGEVRWRSLHPRNAFPDARCGTDINRGRRFHKAFYVTVEHIEDRYPDTGANIQADMVDESLITSDTDDASGESLNDQVLLVETWYIGKPLVLDDGEQDQGPGLHCIWWAGEAQRRYLAHANYLYYEPGEDPKFPFTFRQRYIREGSVWGYGEPWYLKSPQMSLNKTIELILEGHAHHALGQTIYGAGALSKKQEEYVKQYGSLPGLWAAADEPDKITRLQSQGVPASLQNETLRLTKAMEQLIGRFDVAQGKTPGSVTAFRALDLLAQRARARLKAAEVAITTAQEDCGTYINRLIAVNYNEHRAFRVVGRGDKDEPVYGVFAPERIRKVHMFKANTSVPREGWQPGPDMVEGQDYEIYSPEFDTICKITTPLPSDRMFYLELAKDLFTVQLIDPETFYYVLDNGHFPPWEEVAERIVAHLAQRQAMQAGVPTGAPVQDAPAQIPPEYQAIIESMDPDLLQQFAALSPEDQQGLLERLAAEGAGAVG